MNKQKNTLITDLDDSFLTNFQKNDDNIEEYNYFFMQFYLNFFKFKI